MTGIHAQLRAARAWVSNQPDRPFVIFWSHAVVLLLYASGHAVSKVPFRGNATRSVISSSGVPVLHGLALLGLLVAMKAVRLRGSAALISFATWTGTTVALYFAATQRQPQLALWACGLASVITVATFLMVLRWGVDGDDSEER